MNNSNALERLSNIFCLLQNKGCGASIKQISNALGIPINVIREDIKTLLKNETFSSYFDEDLWDDELFEEDFIMEDNAPCINDDTLLTIDSGEFHISSKQVPFYITHREKELLGQYYPDLVERSNKKLYMTKDAPTKLEADTNNLCQLIQLAIDSNQYIKFSYKNAKDGSLKIYELAPKLIYHNTSNGRMYMITLKDNEQVFAWRLDRMFSCTTIKNQTDTTPIPQKIMEKFDYFWALDLDTINEPVHIKIRIEGYNRNIIEKIQNDISRRKYAKFYQDGDYWYYEDKIIGLSSFRSWIYQFGSAMVVMEPAELAKDVYNSALERLKKYKGEQ